MIDRRFQHRDIEMAWAGWPIPEMIGGAVVGGLLMLSVVTVVPQLAAVLPNVVGVVLGAVLGAVLSWIWRPRHLVVRSARATPEEQRTRSRAA